MIDEITMIYIRLEQVENELERLKFRQSAKLRFLLSRENPIESKSLDTQ